MFKKVFRALALPVIPYLAYLLVRAIYLTCKKTFHLPNKIPNEPIIFAFWHGELLMQAFGYPFCRTKERHNISVISSTHFDGQLMTKFDEYFKFKTIKLEKKKPIRALLEAIKRLKDGGDLAITPDGPRGPRHEVQVGIVTIAQKADAYIVIQNFSASNFWRINSWDKFIIPKPFSKLNFFISEPFKVSNLGKEEAKELIKTKLMEKCEQR